MFHKHLSEFIDVGLGKRIEVTFIMSTAPVIIINYPGSGGVRFGYNDKYLTLYDELARRGIAASALMPNRQWDDIPYEQSVLMCLRAVHARVKEIACHLTGLAMPSIYLVGTSAGGSAVAALADELKTSKILLIAPSSNAGEAVKNIRLYSGEVWIVAGADDEVVRETPAYLFSRADMAARREYVEIPKCDHQFRGTHNGKILSKAPLWAFFGETTFPSPDGGLKLY